MGIRRIRSKKNHGKNRVHITMDVQTQNLQLLETEIKKAIRRWNRQLEQKISYEVLIINQDNNQLEG